MAKTWFTRGQIYHALYKDPKYGKLCDNCLVTAYESYQKAMELEPNNEWAPLIQDDMESVIRQIFNEGAEAYQAKDYNTALAKFETVQRLNPTDTNAIMNAGTMALRLNNYEKARDYYSKLIAMKVPDPTLYEDLSKIQLQLKDTNGAQATINKGRELYPDSVNLLHAQINLYLETKQTDKAMKALNEATAKDPNNPFIYLVLGNSYENIANPFANDGTELPKPANHSELITKAEDAYKSGLKIAPDNYVLNYKMGILYFNQAAEMNNQANAIQDNTKYAAAETKFKAKFRDAEPYLRKAMEKNPKKSDEELDDYKGTLNALKQLYLKLNDNAKYEEIKAMEKK
jgi:tetratricopeptide (TPR) repeat protein